MADISETQENKEKEGFFDSQLWQGLKNGKLGDFGTEVYFTDGQLIKIGGTVVLVAAIIMILSQIIKKV